MKTLGIGTNNFFSSIKVDTEVAHQTKLFGALMPSGCRQAALRLSCLSGFVLCENTTSPNATNTEIKYYLPCVGIW